MPPSPQFASRRLIFLLAAMVALDSMAIDLYAPAFPQLEGDFAVSPSAIQSTMSIFLLGAGLGQIVMGPVLDAFGRRRPILIGAGFFLTGSLVCALAPSFEMFMLGRAIQSIGAATATVSPRAVIADVYAPKDIAIRLSLVMQIMMISPVIAPLIGAVLLEHFGWRADFYLLAVLGLALLLALARFLPETLPAAQRTALHPVSALKSYAGLIAQPRFAALMLCIGFSCGSLYAFLGASAFTLINEYGVSPITFSLILGGMSLVAIVGGEANIRLLRYFSERRLLLWAVGIQFANVAVLVALLVATAPGLAGFVGLCTLSVAMLGMVFPNASAIAMGDAGAGAGSASAALGISQSLFSASAGLVLAVTGTSALGLAGAMTAFSALAAVAGIFALSVKPAVLRSAAP